MFLPRIFAGFVIASLALSFACNEQDSIELAQGETCFADSVLNVCTCNAYGLGSSNGNYTVVNDCDVAPAGVTWDCVIQLDSQKEATNCACAVAICWQADSTSDCQCGFVLSSDTLGAEDDEPSADGGSGTAVVDHPIVAVCTSPVSGHCCEAAPSTYSANTCVCSSAACAPGTTEVDTCYAPVPISTHALNCAGLEWEGANE